MIPLRIEALKIAYDTAHKVGGFSKSYYPNGGKLEEDIEDVFKLAELNLNYILNGRNQEIK